MFICQISRTQHQNFDKSQSSALYNYVIIMIYHEVKGN